MEKELSARAGVGWMGKNTCIINEEIGSWLLLGEIITTLDLPVDDPALDRCGTCTRCIDACPTGAIVAPYQLDARRCISYLTIEHRGEISRPDQAAIGDWLYGCDICQDVCPWNKKAPQSSDPALRPRFATGTLNIDDVLA
jgi:epoxyqueuosine reductase